MENDNYRKAWLTLIAVTLVLAFAFQGSRGIWEPDEGRYVRCAYEMQKTGNWIIPTINYKPHFTKPPVTYWLIASGISLFGRNEWGARAFHGLAFALTAMLVGFMGRRMWGNLTGLLACLIYATTVLPFLTGNTVTTDTILTFFMTLAVVCFWMSVTSRDDIFKSSAWALAMWISFGVAFLTKGPPALLPLAAIIAYTLLLKRKKRLPAFVTILGIILFAAIPLWWGMQVVRQQEGLLSYLLGHEVIGRIVTAEHGRNPGWFGPFKVYLPVLMVGALPWSCFWPRLFRRFRPGILSLEWWRRLRERPIALFLGLWFGIPLILLSMASSRLPLYVLPLFAPIALMTARGIVVGFPGICSRSLRIRTRPGIAVVALVLILLGVKLVAAHIPHRKDSRAMWNGISKTIEEKAEGAPYEIIVLGSHDGLAFYGDTNVERVTTRERSSPEFIPTEYLSSEYDELLSSRYLHVFLVSDRHANMILPELRKRGINYSTAAAPFGYNLIFCENPNPNDNVVYLAALGGAGADDSARKMLGEALYHIDQDSSLAGVILLGGNAEGLENKEATTKTYEKYFEKPFAPLLDNGAPFYATLGDHGLSLGQAEFQVNYPLFNMNGKRYYSKVFGENLVEAFFLDSSAIRQDARQVEWLKQSLKESKARWKVVAMHHPMYSSAREYPSDPSMIQLLEPIFLDNGVDIVLSGHNHIYERLTSTKGIQYVTVGGGGKLCEENLVPYSPLRIAGDDKNNVFLVLQFDTDRCQLTAYTHNESIIDRGEATRGLSPKIVELVETVSPQQKYANPLGRVTRSSFASPS